ncbi:hypothetical protein SDC9_00480 [bioreactor metagenome]|uniref:Methylamine utilisation protein MauE domain-containing protein n=1 Tax=bioreactor metagenome TaxID=1076179 RepID=A0A644SK02_9ZZZZ
MHHIKANFKAFISYFFILLFCYAAISKIMDFEKFQIQMKDSPLLSPFSEFLPLFIIVIELFFGRIVMLSENSKYRTFRKFYLNAHLHCIYWSNACHL